MITSRNRGPIARGLTMQTIAKGNERMRIPPAVAFAPTKNLIHEKYDIIFGYRRSGSNQ